MSDRDLFGDVRQTGEEASRWLDALERDASADVPAKEIRSEPVASVPSSPPSKGSSNAAGCWGALVFFGLMLGFGVLIASVLESNGLSTSNDTVELTFRPSCGSSSSASGQWWPVLGPANARLVSTIKTDYCGDAYINEQGALQIASFSTENAANDFAAQISRATGASFRVGQSRGW
mgnify:CR=1 FL=1